MVDKSEPGPIILTGHRYQMSYQGNIYRLIYNISQHFIKQQEKKFFLKEMLTMKTYMQYNYDF